MNNSYKKAMDKIELSDKLKDKIINNTSKAQENKNHKFNPVFIKRLAVLAACFVFCFLSYYAVTNYYIQSDTDIIPIDVPKQTADNVGVSEKTAVNENAQEQPSLKAFPDKNEENAVINPPAYKNAEINGSKAEVFSPKQEADEEDNLPEADNDLPAFSKGKVSADTNDTVIQQLTVEEVSAILGYEIQFPQDIPDGYEVSNISVANSIAKITYQNGNNMITYRTAKSSEDLSQNDDAYEFMEIVNVNNTDIVLKGNEELYYNAVWTDNTQFFSIKSDNGIEKNVIVEMISSVDYTEKSDTNSEK